MKILILLIAVLSYLSCNTVDSNISDGFYIRTEKILYRLNNTPSIQTSFKNNLGVEVKIINSSCGGLYFIIEKYVGKNWILFSELPICERLPEEPIKLADESTISIKINISLISNLDVGKFRMKFHILESTNNRLIENKYLYSNQFSLLE